MKKDTVQFDYDLALSKLKEAKYDVEQETGFVVISAQKLYLLGLIHGLSCIESESLRKILADYKEFYLKN